MPGADEESPPHGIDVAALWRQYEDSGDAEGLLLHYRSLVERIATRMSLDLPSFVERADLVSYGVLGLVDAIGKFDRTRGVRFETYATSRIRGAILDGLRSIDWIPRSVRAKFRTLARAEAALQMTLHRKPTEAEVATEVGLSVAGLRKLFGEVARSSMVRLDDVPAPGVDGLGSPVAAARDTRADQPGYALEAAERQRAVACALEGLNDRDRTVIDLYYYRGLKLTEIGRMLGVTEARVSQLHSRARSALRETLIAMDL